MSALLSMLKNNGAAHARILAGPILIVMVLGMMVLLLPTFLLDLLFTFNIALSVMILLVAMFTRKPLDFAAFPAVLLFATLLRLSLNVASTRVVLLHGHTGPDAAGKVIEAFGHFLVGGNFAVGIILFVILTIINFIVITKGAGRIAEVGARFTLDAMPGKQMAIDADLNAGLIGEDEARKRRAEVSQESDFFGSMDGASKFVRGDAIAGLLIMAINIIGGLIVGVAQHDMSMSDSARVYAADDRRRPGGPDPGAGDLDRCWRGGVARVHGPDIGQQMISQLFSNPSVMFLTAGIIGIMGLIPNMPHIAFLTLAGGLAWGGWALNKRRKAAEEAAREVPPQAVSQAQAAAAEASWDDVSMVDQLGLEVGYRLIPLVDHAQNGELLHRIRSLRKKFAQDVGFLPPVVHIRDNLELKPNDYRILLSGVEVGHGVAMPGQWLAIDPGGVTMQIKGTPTTDPAFGLPALWIDGALRDQAQVAGYYGGGCRHGRGHPSEPPDAPPRLQPARPPGSAAVARTHRPRLARWSRTWCSRRCRSRRCRRCCRACGRSADPRYAHHHRYAVRAWPAPAALAAATGGQPDIQELIALTRRSLGRAITQQWFPARASCA